MKKKQETYLQAFFPLWMEGIKSWFGWDGWRKAMTSLLLTVGTIYAYLYFNQIDVAIQNIEQLFLAAIIGLFWFFFIAIVSYISANIKLYKKQKNKIDTLTKENEQLTEEKGVDIQIRDTYIHNILDENKNEMIAVVLEAKNGDMKRKIVELEAEIVFMQQSSIDPEEGEITVLFSPSQLLVWQSGTTRIDLRPDASEAFCLCYFASRPLGAPLRVHFGAGEFTNHLFEREAVYQMNIKFTGKYEDEVEFRQCQVMQTIYAKPLTKELMTGDLAGQMQLLDIPEKLFRVLEAAKTGGWIDYSSPFRRQQEQKKVS